MKQVFFVFLFFLDSVGDALFLTGVPLYLYKLGEASTTRSLLLLLAITLGTLISRKLILKLTDYNSFLIVGVGEVVVALVELLLLFVISIQSSVYVFFIATVMIAMVYNLYAGLKYFHLIPALAKPEQYQRLISMQSMAYRCGVVCGAALSGIVLERLGINQLILIDALTFALFGVSCLIVFLFKAFEVNHNKDVGVSDTNEHCAKVDFFQQDLLFLLLIFGSVFVSWEQASAASIVISYTAISAGRVTLVRGIVTLFSLSLFYFIVKGKERKIFTFYSFSVICLLILLLSNFFTWNLNLFIVLVLLLSSLIAPYIIPVQSKLLSKVTENTKDMKRLTAELWIVLSVAKLSLFPANILRDKFGLSPGFYFAALFASILLASLLSIFYLNKTLLIKNAR